MNRNFTKEDIYEANKNEKMVIREIQIKTTLRYHLTPVRMAIIKKSGDNRYWRGLHDQNTKSIGSKSQNRQMGPNETP